MEEKGGKGRMEDLMSCYFTLLKQKDRKLCFKWDCMQKTEKAVCSMRQ